MPHSKYWNVAFGLPHLDAEYACSRVWLQPTSARHSAQVGQDSEGPVQRHGLSLLTATVKAGAGDGAAALRFAFRVVSPAGTLALQAGSEAEQREWMAALQVRV